MPTLTSLLLRLALASRRRLSKPRPRITAPTTSDAPTPDGPSDAPAPASTTRGEPTSSQLGRDATQSGLAERGSGFAHCGASLIAEMGWKYEEPHLLVVTCRVCGASWWLGKILVPAVDPTSSTYPKPVSKPSVASSGADAAPSASSESTSTSKGANPMTNTGETQDAGRWFLGGDEVVLNVVDGLWFPIVSGRGEVVAFCHTSEQRDAIIADHNAAALVPILRLRLDTVGRELHAIKHGKVVTFDACDEGWCINTHSALAAADALKPPTQEGA